VDVQARKAAGRSAAAVKRVTTGLIRKPPATSPVRVLIAGGKREHRDQPMTGSIAGAGGAIAGRDRPALLLTRAARRPPRALRRTARLTLRPPLRARRRSLRAPLRTRRRTTRRATERPTRNLSLGPADLALGRCGRRAAWRTDAARCFAIFSLPCCLSRSSRANADVTRREVRLPS
jgi:hypothetical protein